MTALDAQVTQPSGLADLARAHRDRTRSPVDTIEDVLATIDRLDDQLGAWQAVYADDARRAAAGAADRVASGHRSGPFHGIPFALKDIVDVEGRITTAGSAEWLDRVSPGTATIARRLMAAGGVLVGKTKTVEFALGGWGMNEHLGCPHNPWDADRARAPGGSSSGSGVAVAAGMVPCAIGTDTGGSVRLPAAFCGIVGLKTTEGLLPTNGIVPLSHTLDTPGPMTRSVEDAALMFDVLTGRNPIEIDDDWSRRTGLYGQLERDVRGLRLGILSDDERTPVDAEVLAHYDEAIDRLADMGADIKVFHTPLRFETMKEMTFVIVTAEAWHHHGRLFDDPNTTIDSAVRARGLPGRDLSAARYVEAQLARAAHRSDFQEATDGFDALITPTTLTTAPALVDIDQETTPAHFTRAANYLGLCALSMPMALSKAGLPTSLQIMGRGNDEALVLRIGAAFERTRSPLAAPAIR